MLAIYGGNLYGVTFNFTHKSLGAICVKFRDLKRDENALRQMKGVCMTAMEQGWSSRAGLGGQEFGLKALFFYPKSGCLRPQNGVYSSANPLSKGVQRGPTPIYNCLHL